MKQSASLLVLAILVGMVPAACNRKAEVDAGAAAADQAPALSAEAGQAALDLIIRDLNLPLTDVQSMLAAAAADGDVSPDELSLSTPDGSIRLDWWIWNRGFLRLAEDPEYGPYLELSDKGRRFLQMDASTWLSATLVGTPLMQCQSAGSATSAACTAVVTYASTAGRNADLGGLNVPQASADLEAVFAPGQGWSVSRLSTDGDTPAVLVRKALFGTPEEQDAARVQYQTSLRTAVERLDRSAAERQADAAPTQVAAPVAREFARDPKLASTAAPRAQSARITNPAYVRRPTNEELASLFPSRALDENVSGRSTMTCTVTVSGRLADCSSTGEYPVGYRFGQAGVSAARFFVMTPRTEDGRAVSSSVSLSINWTL